MLHLKDVQQKTADLIVAHATFAGESVLVDLGKASPDEETALGNAGHVVTVLPLLDGDTVNQGASEALLQVGVAVSIRINPEKSTKNIYQLLVDAKDAVTGWKPLNPNDRFALAEKAFVVDDSDPGSLGFILFFRKKCVF